ncbi:PfkB family carbohydrate kinase [Lamprobacter modestohalophilus]|uniref:PfkB family carbohydrate kinase n=1 Tax=Lamprobacter modestohalophilus TaxID=1064514 RepID=UPI002ADED791|nr:PfkB family carbohydrate kinase [Lamprobacter modestohalophilus]MEA1050585.1 PfkB family carbohydrate kinase [Lamprobacter modestohalophilus]
MALATSSVDPRRPAADPPHQARQPSNFSRSARILGVGIATLDIINQVERYPAEDDEVRALSQRRLRGGNCANTLAVLNELGHNCHWAGTLADDSGAAFIRQDLTARGIDLSAAKTNPGGATPTSYITLSRATGSRTIVHHRDLPELSAADFAQVDLSNLDWAHFEGRNPAETEAMIGRVAAECPGLPISVEIEKPRPGIERLFRLPSDRQTLLIVSRAFAEQHGAREPETFLQAFANDCNATLLILPWGAKGAYALTAARELLFAPAHPPATVVDTIAAGDVFNAAVIDALLQGADLAEVLERANALAGRSCGQLGIDGLNAVPQASSGD